MKRNSRTKRTTTTNTSQVSAPKIMAKCGYNRTTALPIRGGPKALGGVGL